MAKVIALYQDTSWKSNTPQSPGVDFTIPSDFKNPEKHPSFSVTSQSDMDSTDINKIMARYEKTGLIPDMLTGLNRLPMYGDFTGIGQYHDMKIRLARANELFDALPAATRNKFDNDPQKLIDFASKVENHQELVNLGLMTREEYDVLNPPPPIQKDPQAPAAPAPGQPANPAA